MIDQDPEQDPMEVTEHLEVPEDVLVPEPPVARAEDEGLPPAEPAFEDVQDAEPEPAPAAPASNMLWYIIHTYSGFEAKVAESLKTRAQAFGFDKQIGQILMPKETVVELRNGKKVTSERLLYPGYLMVEMEMDDRLWHEVKATPRVTGFVGGGTKPIPMTADEVNQMLYRQSNTSDRPRPKQVFEKGESVRINDGPFVNFTGKVEEVHPERDTLRVLVTIFGRSTPVELEFLQVEKV
jgi:transcriptional antiterminator NusG